MKISRKIKENESVSRSRSRSKDRPLKEDFKEMKISSRSNSISSSESHSQLNSKLMPFQNRQKNIKKIAEALMQNQEAAEFNEPNMINLISFSQCMGTGKTRTTKDFLNILK